MPINLGSRGLRMQCDTGSLPIISKMPRGVPGTKHQIPPLGQSRDKVDA